MITAKCKTSKGMQTDDVAVAVGDVFSVLSFLYFLDIKP